MVNVDLIFRLMREQGKSQKDLADAIGISQGNVTDWKKQRAKPSAKVPPKIAAYLGVTTGQLLGETPAPNATEPEQRIEAYDLMPGYGYSDLDDEDKEFVEAQMKHMVEQLLKKKKK
jgi:transcriptional regulator with XRE-family HTH domain